MKVPIIGSIRQKGMALITVMLFTAILSILLIAISRAAATHLRLASNQRDMEQALFVAEGAVERAAAHIAAEGDVPVTFTGTIGDGTYLVTILNGGKITMGNCSVGGAININPNNSPNNEFYVKLPDGTQITRSNLHQDYSGYTGPATIVHVKPKGNGNQNGLLINGNEYVMENKSTYEILCPTMVVNIYNDHVNPQGKAVGKWWIAIAATGATVVEGL